ncbi:phosphatase PAP2 family protein [Novosphingobium resinovorum]|uniref:phosphatase PAP2 family protein n=1 Tax=Novosphingobium resinovorum TaxID=158500 RepID=UPI002ED61B85|nr:phosphatase PAP2 family protein [Novosphingobium resinovorum]
MPSLLPSSPASAPGFAKGSIETAGLVEVRAASPAIRPHLMAALLLNIVVVAALLHAAQLRIDPWTAGARTYFAAALLLVLVRFALPRTNWRHAGTVAHFTEYTGLFTLISVMGATASYPVAALTHGYADATLQHIDEALGFGWLAWYRLVAAHPVLQALGTVAYRSIYVTPAMILWCAARAGRHDFAYRFIAGFWVATVITLALFSLMPAVGPFSYLWHGAIPYMPESEQWQSGLIPALRAHGVHFIDLGRLRGIVSAPSFHTAAAVLYVVAGWRIAALRWPIVALNLMMMLSTPVEGTHYLADMLLGAVVALLSLALVAGYCGRMRSQA